MGGLFGGVYLADLAAVGADAGVFGVAAWGGGYWAPGRAGAARLGLSVCCALLPMRIFCIGSNGVRDGSLRDVCV